MLNGLLNGGRGGKGGGGVENVSRASAEDATTGCLRARNNGGSGSTSYGGLVSMGEFINDSRHCLLIKLVDCFLANNDCF